MVWAITQNTVNSQLDWLSGQTIPTQVTIGNLDDYDGSIVGTIAPPTVDFATGEPHLAYLYLTFQSGTFEYWHGHGRNQVTKTSDIKGWKIAFSVHLNIAQIAQDYIKGSKAVPREILDMLTKFDDTMFSIQSIFMDFQNSDLSTFNDLKSKLPDEIDNEVKDNFNQMMRLWLLNHKGTDNPFILGFPVTHKQVSDDVKAVLNPTGANLSTHAYEYPENKNDGSKDGLSTLNFLMVTGNRNILKEPALMRPDAGSFHKNLVETNDIDGKGIIARETFFNNYLWDLLIKPFQDKVMKLGDYAHARDDARKRHKNFREEINDKTNGFVEDTDGWHYGDHVKLSWKETGDPIHLRESEQNIQFKVSVSMANDFRPEMMNAQRLTLTITGSVYRYEWDQTELDMGPLGDLYVGKGWANALLSYTITIQFITGIDGKISIYYSSKNNDIVKDSGTGGVFKMADFFNEIFNIDSIAKDWSTNAASLANVESDMVSKLLKETGPILDNAMTKLILPGRKEFFYKNILMNTDGDIEIDLAYKTE